MKLDDLPNFPAAYFETLGGDLVFAEPPPFVQLPPENNTLLGDHDVFVFNPKKLV